MADDSSDWAPRWKGTVGTHWERNHLSADLTGRYVSHYRDYDPLASGAYLTLGNFWIFDAHASFELPAMSHTFAGIKLSGGAVNLFNRQPQFSMIGGGYGGYDAAQYDIRDRVLYLALSAAL